MIKLSVLQTHHLLARDNNLCQNPEKIFNLREQECVSQIKKCKNLQELKQVHAQILKLGMSRSTFCKSNLLATCAISDWGSMDYAFSIFREIQEPGSFAFNHMIRGYVKHFKFEESLLIYIDMLDFEVKPDNFTYPSLLKACSSLSALEEGKQIHGHCVKLRFNDDVFVQNSLINTYGKCGEIKFSCGIFDKLEQKTVASWSALISAYANLEMWDECLEVFKKMNSDYRNKPEESILVSVLSACTHLNALNLGRSTHGFLLKRFLGLNLIVETSLIDMYLKFGFLEKGSYIFENMNTKSKFTYSVMISGLALHGCGIEALKLFKEMLNFGIKPDEGVFVSVLSACSYCGLVEEGLELFEKMKSDYKLEPTIQHYGCVIDLMGRSGMINEAYKLIKNMNKIEPNEVMWRSLLNACKIHQNVEIAEIASHCLSQLNSNNPSDYILLSHIYAKARRWDDMAKIRTKIFNHGLVQEPGFTMVELRRNVYKFVSQDRNFPQVYEMLYQMEYQLKFEGYRADTSQVLLDVEGEEKRERLRGHSLKLAIAFALIHTNQGVSVRMTRNFRMCGDCHTYTKFVSKIYEREIVVRDRNRFHCFKDGICSCRDFW